MPPPNIPSLITVALAATLPTSCRAFSPSSSKRKPQSRRPPPSATVDADAVAAPDGDVRIQPRWVPWELVELAADDLQISQEQFAEVYADVEAYTSCDDEGDDLHECDFFGQYLGPTKWLHLTPAARASIDEVHFRIWEDVWSRPHGAVDVADRVSNECLRYYSEFMLEPRASSIECPTDRPLVRVKVVPASFGLEGFEDAVWEATESLMERSSMKNGNTEPNATSQNSQSSTEGYCEAVTFVVASPDLFTDPMLAEGGRASPQAEFEPDQFGEFASALRGKLAMYSKMEGVPLDDAIRLRPLHPMWNSSDGCNGDVGDGAELGGKDACGSFPYPCVAVSTKIEPIRRE